MNQTETLQTLILKIDQLAEIISKQREEIISLKESEIFFNNVVQSSPSAIIITGLDKKIKFCNGQTALLHGYEKPEELIGRNALELLDPSERKQASIYMQKILQGEKIRDIELYCLKKNGDAMQVKVNFTMIPDADGKPLYFMGIVNDISEQKRIEKELIESNQKFVDLAEKSIVGIYLYQDERFQYVNPYFAKITEYTVGEIVNVLGFDDFIYKDDLPLVHKNIKKRLSGKMESINYFFRIKSKTGKIIPVEAFGSITNYRGRRAIIGTLLDITERKQASIKIKESEKRFQQIAEGISDWIWELNSEGKFTYISPRITEMFGYLPKELLGKTPNFLISPDELDRLSESIDPFIIGQKAIPAVQHKMLHKNGHTVFVEISAFPFFDENGKYMGYRGMNRDITAQKQYEQDLIKAKEQAERSDRLKTVFLQNLSHEIRTPMNAILGFSSLLKDNELLSEERNKFIDIINKQGTNLLEIIENIVDLSKFEIQQLNVSNKLFNLSDGLREIILAVSDNEIIDKNPEIEFRYNKNILNESVILNSDEAKIKKIIKIFIKNAYKFTNKGFVELNCRVLEDRILIYVRDSGIGIPEDKKDIIFEKFRQGDDSDTRKFGGLGLGLPVAQTYASLLGGKIWVESQPNMGSIFYFSIPFKAQPEVFSEINVPKQTKIQSNWNNKTILIAEDILSNFEYLKAVLKCTGVKTIHVSDGLQAVEQCKANPDINLILMDIQMPVMDGCEATKQIRTFNKAIPIIAQTAYSLNFDRELVMECGCNNYLVKPIAAKELLDIISIYFDKKVK